MNGVKEFVIVDLFLKYWDEWMSVDGIKTLHDVVFHKPTICSLLFFDRKGHLFTYLKNKN
jgi:hypothetical protein